MLNARNSHMYLFYARYSNVRGEQSSFSFLDQFVIDFSGAKDELLYSPWRLGGLTSFRVESLETSSRDHLVEAGPGFGKTQQRLWCAYNELCGERKA